jgi:hypothetical protein
MIENREGLSPNRECVDVEWRKQIPITAVEEYIAGW